MGPQLIKGVYKKHHLPDLILFLDSSGRPIDRSMVMVIESKRDLTVTPLPYDSKVITSCARSIILRIRNTLYVIAEKIEEFSYSESLHFLTASFLFFNYRQQIGLEIRTGK